MNDALSDYGRGDVLAAQLGLTPEVGVKIAAIITFAGAIEYYLERALWRLRGIEPKGIRPDTDTKPITDLIAMLDQHGAGLADNQQRSFVESWCAAARSGFIIRHNIAHGLPGRLGETLTYMRNPRWEGEARKREFGDFWATSDTLVLVCDAMAALLRPIAQLTFGGTSLKTVATTKAQHALRSARAVLGEFASQTCNPSYEKY